MDLVDEENVARLEVAWTWRAGDPPATPGGPVGGQMQTNPLVVDGVLYGVSPALKTFALDAATGREIWRFDPMSMLPP